MVPAGAAYVAPEWDIVRLIRYIDWFAICQDISAACPGPACDAGWTGVIGSAATSQTPYAGRGPPLGEQLGTRAAHRVPGRAGRVQRERGVHVRSDCGSDTPTHVPGGDRR